MSRRSTRRTAAQQRSHRSSQIRSKFGSVSARPAPHRRTLRLEPLEDRRLLAITVTTLADTVDLNDGLTSLREAIFAANTVAGADTIEFAPALTAAGPATILLTQGELKITDSLTINGPGADLLTIDASGNDPTPDVSNGDGSCVFDAYVLGAGPSTAVDLEIAGLTLTGGDAQSSGGAVRCLGSLRMSDCVVGNNASKRGGAGVAWFAYFANDSVAQTAGFYNCTFVENSSGRFEAGGGIWIHEYDPSRSREYVVSNCNFTGNSSDHRGGGIFVLAKGTLKVLNSEFFDNHAEEVGGAIVAGNVLIDSSLVHGNFAHRAGGGLYLTGHAAISNSTISGNSAELRTTWYFTGGGGIAATGDLIVRHSTVTGNLGGGIAGRSAVLDHTIVAKNKSDSFAGPFDVSATVEMRYSLLGSDRFAKITDLGGNLIGTEDEPIDPLLGPLAENGGPTRTHALLPGSPAINAGDLNAKVGEGGVPQFDQRGEPFGRIVGGRIDIGAFEYQTPTDLNLLVDTLTDESDGDYSRGDLSLREAIELANQNRFAGVTDTIHFDSALTVAGPATILLTEGELKVTDSLTINGPGADLLTIDASGNDPTPEVNDRKGSRVFSVDDGIAASLTTNTISGLRLTGGDIYGSGGAIFSTENLTISKSVVSGNAIVGNSQGYGGGIFVWRGQGSAAPRLVVQESEISGNTTNRSGGGVAVHGGDLEVTSSTIEGNTAGGQGGGVWARGGSVVLNDANLYFNVSSWGAALYRRGGPTSITSSVIDGNIGQRTGAIDNESGKLGISDSSICYNWAEIGSGGGIYSNRDIFEICSSLVFDNYALHDGGGIYGPAVVANSEISGNRAGGRGGGIFTDSLRITGGLVHDNRAEVGGGVYSYSGELSVLNCTISKNAGGKGGGVYRVSTEFDTTIRSSTIYENRAQTGAGIFAATLHDTVMDVEFSSVVGNLAWEMGGGILVLGDGLRINHTSLAGNFALFGYDITGLLGTTIDATYCVIGDNSQSGFEETPPGKPDVNGNIVGGPVHGPLPAFYVPIEVQGPPRWKNPMTVLVATPENPAVNAGDPAAVAGQGGVPTHDQRGAPFTRVYGGRIDIGAVESIPDGFLPGDYLVDGVVDARDYTAWRDSLDKIVSPGSGADGNGDGVIDQRDYAVWTSNFGATVYVQAALVANPAASLGSASVVRQVAEKRPGELVAMTVSHRQVPPLDNAQQPMALAGVRGRRAEIARLNAQLPHERALEAWLTQRRFAVQDDSLSSRSASELDAHGITVVDIAFDQLDAFATHAKQSLGQPGVRSA